MTAFDFHQVWGDQWIEDADGQEFEGIAFAKAEAIRAAREIAANDLRAGRPARDAAFLIADASGNVVARLMFEEAIGARE